MNTRIPHEHSGRFPRRWAWIAAAFLGGHVVLMTTAVTLAVRGHGAAGITPDYYEDALRWDEQRARQRESDALGWRVDVTPDIWLDAEGQRTVRINAADANARPIADAAIELTAFHRLAPKAKREAVAQRVAPGVFEARLPMQRTGEWRITVTMRRGDDTFARTLDQIIAAPPSKPTTPTDVGAGAG